jgi:Protein of unknown function with HXXEE motif
MALAAPADHSMARLGPAWLALTVALAAHVVDEALTDFLSVYNPLVSAARERWAWFPMPTFTFNVWLVGLIILVGVLLLLTPLAYRGVAPVRMAAYPYAAIMLLNGVGHLIGSVYLWRWMPGATTAPLLLVTSVWLLRSSARGAER